MKHYSEILRELREDRDLKQKDIAAILGTTQQQYSKYENHATELPVCFLYQLATYYRVSADYILGRVPYTESSQDFEASMRKKPELAEMIVNFEKLDPGYQTSILQIVKGLLS